ncbi:hypothetical protein DVA86_07555 [Streptomyces armeniacus]|uniref:Uncharacterized protein n=1 Tax=Streptomyces armeniacus TaxID=83291 RepID=A0A345XLL0_9ACTN|nr:hypothetical protein DVA86_07555 [Streptomyces armeniacus]
MPVGGPPALDVRGEGRGAVPLQAGGEDGPPRDGAGARGGGRFRRGRNDAKGLRERVQPRRARAARRRQHRRMRTFRW